MIAVGITRIGKIGFRIDDVRELKGKTEKSWLRETKDMQSQINEIWILHVFNLAMTLEEADVLINGIRTAGRRIF